MENQEIANIVKEYILTELLYGQDVKLTNSTEMISGRILDSITFLKLAVFLEERFEIDVEPHEIGVDNLDTIDLIVGFVQEKL